MNLIYVLFVNKNEKKKKNVLNVVCITALLCQITSKKNTVVWQVKQTNRANEIHPLWKEQNLSWKGIKKI